MLQQTRVESVLPYFRRWMERFPTVESLAAASQEAALSVWEGLGYYTRARNLHRAAQVVVERYGGNLPA
ncbi:MAG TPA: A/G-specific adenine glycosylase, partial [Chloroflexi bacterium]|nr:A/G-specific adenine glycosylase [Chloroflexota bacterium]